MSTAFFVPVDPDEPLPDAGGGDAGDPEVAPSWSGRFLATPSGVGPWADHLLHGGPPSALLVRACERVVRDRAHTCAVALRASLDFLAPVPLGELEVRARTVRGGRRVALAEAVLLAGGQEVLQARTWLLRSGGDRMDEDAAAAARAALPAAPVPDHDPPPPGPTSCPPALTDWAFPYARALEWRHVSGDPVGPGDAAAWARPRIPLLPGEEYSGLQRAVLVADSGNGISAALDWGRWSFVNVDLVVHLSRPVVGEWVLLDARTRYERGGTGLTTSLLRDVQDRVGTGAQTLLVASR